MALLMLEPLLHLAPNDPMVPYYMGLSYKNLKDFEAAKQYLKLAEELTIPWYLPFIHRTMAQIHGLCREFPEAIASYRKVLELDPSDTEVLFEMATTYEEFESDKTVAFQFYRQYIEKSGKGALNEAYARSRMAKIRKPSSSTTGGRTSCFRNKWSLYDGGALLPFLLKWNQQPIICYF